MPALNAPPTRRQEIEHRTIKLIVGVIALSLAGLTDALAPAPVDSISAAYHAGGWPQAFFIGFLFAIAAFLLAYNGATTTEMVLSKIAAVAGLSVALFPCQCGTHDEIIRSLLSASAAVMFGILAFFCYGFYWRATIKGFSQARLTASRVIPLMTREDERFSPFRAENPA